MLNFYCFSQYVKNLEEIYHYNCRRKDEFIKKGLGECLLIGSNIKLTQILNLFLLTFKCSNI